MGDVLFLSIGIRSRRSGRLGDHVVGVCGRRLEIVCVFACLPKRNSSFRWLLAPNSHPHQKGAHKGS